MKFEKLSTIQYLFLAIAPALLFQFFGSILYFEIFPEASVAKVIYLLLKVLMVGWPLLWLKAYLSRRQIKKVSWCPAVKAGVVATIIILVSIYVGFRLFQSELDDSVDLILAELIDWGVLDYFWLFTLGISLLHSLLEEYYWRWFVFGSLRLKLSFISATLISALAFAGHHYILLHQFFDWPITMMFGTLVGVGGFIWAWLYERTGRLTVVWLSHAMADAIILILIHNFVF